MKGTKKPALRYALSIQHWLPAVQWPPVHRSSWHVMYRGCMQYWLMFVFGRTHHRAIQKNKPTSTPTPTSNPTQATFRSLTTETNLRQKHGIQQKPTSQQKPTDPQINLGRTGYLVEDTSGDKKQETQIEREGGIDFLPFLRSIIRPNNESWSGSTIGLSSQ